MDIRVVRKDNLVSIAGNVFQCVDSASSDSVVATAIGGFVNIYDDINKKQITKNAAYDSFKDEQGNSLGVSATEVANTINSYIQSANPEQIIKATDKITALNGVDYDANDQTGYVLLSDGNGGVNTKPLQSVLADSTEVTSIVFDLEDPDSLIDGRLAYDIDRETLVFQSVNGELALGEIYKPVVNNTASNIPAGYVVKASGVSGERFEIQKFKADSNGDEELYLIGVTQKQIDANGGEGLVVTQGVVKHLNTSGWTVGTILYANPAVQGGLISSVPNSPNLAIPVAMVTKQDATNGTIFVRPTIYNHLGEVHDVLISDPSDGQLLTYNNTLGVWQNAFVSVSVNGEPADATGDISVDTGLIPEGSNLYYTDARVESVISAKISDTTLVTSINGEFGDGTGDVSLSTAEIPESQDGLYYTDTRVQTYLTSQKISASYPTTTPINGSTALTSVHEQKMLVCDNGSGMTLQINTGMSKDAEILVYQAGAGAVTISAGSGVTINNTSPFLNITAEQYAIIGLKKLGNSEVWVITGERKLA